MSTGDVRWVFTLNKDIPSIQITWEIQLTSDLKIHYSYKVYYFTSYNPEHRFTCKERTNIHLWLVPCAINPIRTNTCPTKIIPTLYRPKLSSWTREVVVNKLYVVTRERVGWSRSKGQHAMYRHFESSLSRCWNERQK